MSEISPKVKKIYWYGLLILAVSVVLVWIAVFSFQPDFRLKVNFYDVGQGDAIFMQSYRGTQVLIDGGPGSRILEKLGRDLPFYDRSLDLVILTHPHADHVAGLIEVLKRYKIKLVLMTGVEHDSGTYKSFQELLKEKNVTTKTAVAGQRFWLDDSTALSVLQPFERLAGQRAGDPNETSIVTRLSFGKTDFLFMGDASRKNERAIVSAGYTVASEVIKVGHQGSRTSTGEQFLEAVAPEYAVITAGKDNRFGHPHQETLQLLDSEQVKYFRTDQEGDVRMLSDGNIITVVK